MTMVLRADHRSRVACTRVVVRPAVIRLLALGVSAASAPPLTDTETHGGAYYTEAT